MLTLILSFLKVNKTAIIIVTLTITVAYLIYNAGISECQKVGQQAIIDAQVTLEKEFERKQEEALKLQALEYEEQLARAKGKVVIQKTTETVKEYVDKIIKSPVHGECDHLMLDVGGLLKQTTGIVADPTRSEGDYKF